MLEQLKEQFAHAYTRAQLEVMEESEQLAYFDTLTHSDLLKLANTVIEIAKDYGEEIVIRIVEESENLTVFQYAGNGRGERNFGFAKQKGNTVRKSGHNSLWVLAKQAVDGGMDAYFEDLNQCLPVGGAFPLYVNGIYTYTIETSGLHEGNDYRLLLQALSTMQNEVYCEPSYPVF